MSYGDDPRDGITIWFERCAEHPPLKDWPWKNLIQSSCPVCTYRVDSDKTEREMKARRLLEQLP